MKFEGPISPEDILTSGWLYKQSRYVKDWRRRWFVMTSTALLSFKDGTLPYGEPTEVLLLHECTTVKSVDMEIERHNAFRVDTHDRKFYLIAETSAEKESWIGHIGKQMIKPSVALGFQDVF